MAGKGNFLTTYRGKQILGIVYGGGAAVVIIGAWAKILHLPIANTMLTVGLLTEAVIFIISCFEPPHMDTDWSRVYPELADDVNVTSVKKVEKKASSTTEQLDNMLSKAKIEQDLLDRLGANMGKLSENIGKMSEVADAAGATSEYTTKAREASTALTQMKDAYSAAATTVAGLASASEGMNHFHQEVQKVSQNLSQLNSMYELELADSSNHLKAMNKFYGNLVDAMGTLESTKDDAVKYKEHIGNLNKNIASLNQVYGGMLNAMRPQA